jgi:methionyl-tRNA formyltransferase
MRIAILGNNLTDAYVSARQMVLGLGHDIAADPRAADVAIAPLLTEILPPDRLTQPRFGTLIFHPSPLPFGRGASSIKWAYKRGDLITAATWFWADAGIDSGPICEQEIISIDHSLRPREFYERHIIPAMLRTLKRCLNGLSIGLKREVEQIETYSTYEAKI